MNKWHCILFGAGLFLAVADARVVPAKSTLEPQALSLADPSLRTASGNGGSDSSQVSADGRYLVFGYSDQIYRRDLLQQQTQPLISAASQYPIGFFSLTPDGRYVAYTRANR